jgi:hypothetical protein
VVGSRKQPTQVILTRRERLQALEIPALKRTVTWQLSALSPTTT